MRRTDVRVTDAERGRKKTAEQALAVLVARNLVEPVLPGLCYVPANLAAGAALLLLARRNGSSWEELGLARRGAGHGLRTGGPVALAVAGGMLVGAVLPPTRALFNDERVAVGAGAPELVYPTTFRVPVGTVAFEELAFRGVLLDLLRKRLPPGTAVAVNTVTFGLWHILPTLAMAKANKIRGCASSDSWWARCSPPRRADMCSPAFGCEVTTYWHPRSCTWRSTMWATRWHGG
jgi:membrane protease YdiL (CAAX protease family)